MKKNKQSFVMSCVLYLSIYSIMLLITFLLMNTLIEKSINNIYLDIDSLKIYQDYLDEDEFDRIPLRKFLRNEIVVFDENNEIIFETHNYEKKYLSPAEFDFIADFSSDTYFLVQNLNDDGITKYMISRNNYDSTTEDMVDFAIVDSDYNILSGNLFKNKTKLSKREFELLKNGINGKSNVSKYVYMNNNNKTRTLLFYQRNLSTKEYIKISNKIKSKWILLLPIVIVETIIIIYLFYRKIKKSIYIMNKKILDSENNSDVSIPIEFEDFYKKILELLTSLNEEKNKRIEQERVKQSIITNLSHDIKTPLTVIQGYAKAFDDGVVPKDKEEKYIKSIYEKSVLATDIINSLFQYSRMEHFEFKPTYENLNFTEFCREYLALKYTDLEIQKYKLEFKIEEKECMYEFDKMLMTRLFDNIINNCVKHNKIGTTIYFIYKIKNNRIIIDIADNGKGLSLKDTNKLFEPFVVGNEARTSGLGTGLGLHIAKRIVNLHNGQIKIINKPIKPYKFELEIIFNYIKKS